MKNKSGIPLEIPLLYCKREFILLFAVFLFDLGDLGLILFDLLAFGHAFEALVLTASGEGDRRSYHGNADGNVGGCRCGDKEMQNIRIGNGQETQQQTDDGNSNANRSSLLGPKTAQGDDKDDRKVEDFLIRWEETADRQHDAEDDREHRVGLGKTTEMERTLFLPFCRAFREETSRDRHNHGDVKENCARHGQNEIGRRIQRACECKNGRYPNRGSGRAVHRADIGQGGGGGQAAVTRKGVHHARG